MVRGEIGWQRVVRLLHYTSTPLERVRSVSQDEGRADTRYDKPNGLWVSVEGEDDWLWWCEAEQFGNPRGQQCYEVVLAPEAKILHLATGLDLLAFTADYGFNPYPEKGWLFGPGYGIRWPEVAARYQGIIIAPYQWEHRLEDETRWYYGWDCASGCIWDAEAVERIALVERADATRAEHT